MRNITSTVKLKEAILMLRILHAQEELLLKEQLHQMSESLKPFNLIKSSFKGIISPALHNNSMADAAIGMTTGFVAKKVLTGAFSNPLIKLFGILLQVGVSNFVTKHPDAIKSSGQYIFKRVFQKRNNNDSIKS